MKREDLMDWSAMDDGELALALQRGEDQAFDEMVRRHQGRVYAVAYRLTANREDALDAAQESLFKAYQRIHAWRPTGSFVPWLLRVTANVAIDHIRRRKRRAHERFEETVLTESEGASVEPTHSDTGRQVQAIEIDERIREALVRLSETQRTVFVLRHYEGLQLAEIAQELGCTTGSVKVHLFRALKKLQKELADLRQ